MTSRAEQAASTAPTPPRRGILIAVAIGVTVIFAAPLVLSATDLHAWATAERGLDQNELVAWAVPVGLDLAAVVCLAMKLLRSLSGQKGGIFGLLAWAFIAGSAFAQFSHGRELIASGAARDVWWAMPAFAALGPVLLDAVLHQWRQWRKQDHGLVRTGASGFGQAWLVAPRETARAWIWSRRANILSPNEAVDFVRNYDALRAMSAQDALRYALSELRTGDLHEARKLLQRMRLRITQADVDAVDAHLRDRLAEQIAQSKSARAAAQEERAAQAAHVVEIAQPRRARSAKPQVARPAQDVAQEDQRNAALRNAAELVRSAQYSRRAAAQELNVPESTLRAWMRDNPDPAQTTAHLKIAQ